ncbi:permease [Photobacterium carnosum]|uniref:permease n=1 Tax=Photobacterium carnosum TaxID=2023717 RepID=UPI001E2CF080|nr:permease [Photobacterium carnosum]MCD9530903.1 metal ion permease [Photobacterium carnosum]MCD9542292.1 metal ion permease [Photobacterium carnosum]MCF2154764.1 metal ion permease [Photobacterium carnosum]MCF2216702.1 metal ion permease [Photobacterium carnosum]
MIGQDIGGLVIHLFSTFGNMVWQIFWPLAFGLMLSSWIRNLLPVSSVVKHLGKTTVVSLGFTTFLGMVSSSCSYAAASLSHTLLTKKATVANAMAFLVSSTNLIIEMFIVLVALMGWTFFWGEVIGGLILIATAGFLFSRFYPKDVEQELRQHLLDAQPQKASCGMDMSEMSGDHSDCGMDMSKMKSDDSDCSMDMSKMKADDSDCGMDMSKMKSDDSDCGMDMSKMKADDSDCGMDMSKMKSDDSDCGMDMSKMKADDSDCGMDMSSMKSGDHSAMKMNMAAEPQSATMEKITKSAGFFQMDIAMIGKEILIGVVVSSILIALMPQDGWRDLFISNDAGLPVWLHSFLDVIIGIFVAMVAYVCSVGNLILAAALWHGGISFGGVIGFILSDVLTIPMIRVYQKYYGKRPTKWMVGLLFVSILFTGLCVDAIFNGFGWVTTDQTARALNQSGFGLNFTTVMNLIFIPVSIWYYRLGKKANASMGMSM